MIYQSAPSLIFRFDFFLLLGKDYQELRVKKRERKQPSTIVNLPYLTWEKTGQAPVGPYAVSIYMKPYIVSI